MAFSDEYNEYLAFMRRQVAEYGQSPLVYANMLPDMIKEENFEAAQAILDFCKEFIELNQNKEQ